MVKIIVLLAFAINFLYNFKCKQKNIIKVKIQKKFILIISAFALVVLIMCYKFDNSLLGYITGIFAILSIYSSVFYQRISGKGIHITMNSTTILKLVKFDKIDKINIEKNNDDLKIKIYAYGNTFTQIYDSDDEDEIRDMLVCNY
ncbi:hypothetical protein [Finegoldia magna]|uniref:hypothetical protein n=1 Tax=Finegoldia magna TaxID=1260 RepID=UPI0026F0C30A|nr:hypothetical protein [Finegoldia magna]MBS5943100.1 hypothetical protein [Finegoldia magna]MDU1580291.1 hypothetical protein [Finegoldia magna]MDU1601105.1 hypothetical protein [Finegoldia magna]MDU5700364.1 hypothetical protein [Finegoldia magna]